MTEELIKMITVALGNLKTEHGDELLKLVEHYGPQAADKILEMLFGDEEVGSKIYYEALYKMSPEDLLDSAMDDFDSAIENKEKFTRFLAGLGTGLGVILKTLLKSVSPI